MKDLRLIQCVVCGAKAEFFIGDKGDYEESIPFCQECHRDGSCQKWLEDEIRKTFIEGGYTCRIDEQGRELWTDPKDKHPPSPAPNSSEDR